jgi:antitoxin (DNA-binding transcriptional repressor) of toxin-antitoxin stability system
MRRMNATEAARHFSELLDEVEHGGQTFVVERHGRVVASIGPTTATSGRAVKELLRSQPRDEQWSEQLDEMRAGVTAEARPWND